MKRTRGSNINKDCIRFNPSSLRLGITSLKGFGCLLGNAFQLSDTFFGHSTSDGVPIILKYQAQNIHIINVYKSYYNKVIIVILSLPKDPIQLVSFAGTWK